MTRYENLSGTSGVTFFDVGPDFIKVQFGESDDVVYVYDHVAPGEADVTRMKELAVAGRGLSAYISQHIRDRYHWKEPRSA